MQDNTAKACLGPPPSSDPELPVLFQEGRADLITLHKCAGRDELSLRRQVG